MIARDCSCHNTVEFPPCWDDPLDAVVVVVPVAMGSDTLQPPLLGTRVMMVLVCPLIDMATGCKEKGGGGCGGGSGVVGEATADLGRICRDFFVAVAAMPRGVRSEECRVRPAICWDLAFAEEALALPEPFLLL